MREIITVYKTECYEARDPEKEGENCSLLPWRDADGMRGADDGGRDYVLPASYTQKTDEAGEPAVLSEQGNHCRVMLHNGVPLLVDEERGLAFLLEPVKKMASLREASGLTRGELADRLGVTQKELFEWENLEKKPDPAMLARIADILGCSPGDFR